MNGAQLTMLAWVFYTFAAIFFIYVLLTSVVKLRGGVFQWLTQKKAISRNRNFRNRVDPEEHDGDDLSVYPAYVVKPKDIRLAKPPADIADRKRRKAS